MDVTITSLPDVKIVTPARFGDERGFFSEIYNRRALADVGIDMAFNQENHAFSADRGTLRGLHFQCPPATQTKLLRVLRGAIVDVCVDCRKGSPTFGQHVMVELLAESGQQILCPKGFAHGILTLMPHTEIAYKVDAYYAPELDLGIRFDDPVLGIDWPLPKSEMILSEKDRNLPDFRDLPDVFTYPETMNT
jgi:dTDP-4-dehydrorhamnose 3,5-epimerase